MNLFLIIFVEKKLDGDKWGAKGPWGVYLYGREGIHQAVSVWGMGWEVVLRERELRM